MNNDKLKEVIQKLRVNEMSFVHPLQLASLLESLLEPEKEEAKGPQERYFKCIETHKSFTKNKIYKVGEQNNYPITLTICGDDGIVYNVKNWTKEYVSHHNNCFQEVTKEDYDRQEQGIVEENKPLFTFEGHNYFRESKIFYYITKKCQEVNNLYDIEKHNAYNIMSGSKVFYNGAPSRSKIYPTEELCKEGLNTYIWENHMVTAKEMGEISRLHFWDKSGIAWENFFCETIIKQKNNG